MNSFKLSLLLILLFQGFYSQTTAQQLLINEISQGTGSREYVEFVVVGAPTCQNPVPCMDLRGMVIDDNNGDFGSGSGFGIAQGAVRFADIPFWSCVPQGTLIVVYNNMDVNPALPPDDLSLLDGNCRLIIPVNSVLLEGQGISPTISVSTYPANASWVAGTGDWSGQIAMANLNDSFQIRQSNMSASALHSVSWGNNTNNNQIYFSGSASGLVFSMMNTVGNNSFVQSNWSSGAVGTNETPGLANSSANDAWIGSMNPQCGIANTMNLTLNSTPTGCGSTCIGTASVSVSGGTAPYSYSWSNGGTTASLSGICPTTYTVTVTDFNNCQATDQVIVGNNSSSISVSLTPTHPTCLGDCNGSITSSVSGSSGTVTYLWSNTAGTQNISNLCAANYSLTVTDQAGCSATATSTLSPGLNIPDATIITAGPFGNTDPSVQFTSISSGGIWSADCGSCMTTSGIFNPSGLTPGTYQICHLVGVNPCTDNECVTITIVQGCIPQTTSEVIAVCPGVSVLFDGQTYNTPGNYSATFTGANGCDSTHTLALSNYSVTPLFSNNDVCLGDSVLVDGAWYFDSQLLVGPINNSNGCLTTITHTIAFEDCTIPDFEVFIPNVFTPNGDFTNDIFPLSILGGTLENGFILNRWGDVIYEFSPTELTWDGKTKQGSLSPEGVYTYVAKVIELNGTRHEYHGFVTLAR